MLRRRSAPKIALTAQVVLALALLVAVVGWRDSDVALRVSIALIGVAGLLGGLAAYRVTGFRWVIVAIDTWFVLLGAMLSLSVAGARAGVDHWDPAPAEIARLQRFEAWLDPAIHGPVAAAFLIAGTIGALAVARRSRHPA